MTLQQPRCRERMEKAILACVHCPELCDLSCGVQSFVLQHSNLHMHLCNETSGVHLLLGARRLPAIDFECAQGSPWLRSTATYFQQVCELSWA